MFTASVIMGRMVAVRKWRLALDKKVKLKVDVYIALWLYIYMAINIQSARQTAVFAALADPTRRAIVARLTLGEADVSELMKPFALTQPTISKHLGVLERAGLVVRARDAQRRPRRLVPQALKEVADWVEPFRQLWDKRFKNLDAYLTTMQKKK